MDGTEYTYNGKGEFWLLRSITTTAEGTNPLSEWEHIRIQVRLEQPDGILSPGKFFLSDVKSCESTNKTKPNNLLSLTPRKVTFISCNIYYVPFMLFPITCILIGYFELNIFFVIQKELSIQNHWQQQ